MKINSALPFIEDAFLNLDFVKEFVIENLDWQIQNKFYAALILLEEVQAEIEEAEDLDHETEKL